MPKDKVKSKTRQIPRSTLNKRFNNKILTPFLNICMYSINN